MVHHVFFWLHDPTTVDQLIAGLQKMTGIPEIRRHHIGIPAATNRDVIDNTYHVSWLLEFDDVATQEIYQGHPVHHEFIDNCKHLWSKVLVYDTIPA